MRYNRLLWRRAVRLLCGILCGGAVLAPASGRAVDYAWNNAAGGNWNVASNWSPAGVPTSLTADRATISLTGTYTITINDQRSVLRLTVNNAGTTLAHSDNFLTIGSEGFALQSGTYTISGLAQLFVNAGTGMTAAADTTVNINGGVFNNFDGTNGGGPITINGNFNWNSGVIGQVSGPHTSQSGTITVNGTATIATTASKQLYGQLLNFNGSTTWSDGNIDLQKPGANLRIGTAGVFRATNNNSIKGAFGSDNNARVEILGTFIKETGAGTTTIGGGVVPINLLVGTTGTIDVRSGTLLIPSDTVIAATTYTGTTLAAGTWRVAGGTIDLGGRSVSTIGPNATVKFDGSGTTSSNFAALNSLTTINGNLQLLNGASFTPTATTITNTGTIVIGSGTTFARNITGGTNGNVNVSGTLDGTVSIANNGSLTINSGGIVTGAATINSGGTATIHGNLNNFLTVASNGTATIGSSGTVTGNATVSGTLTVNGALTGSTLTVNSTGTATINSSFGGTSNVAGTLVNNGTISGAVNTTAANATLNGSGTFAGTVTLANNSFVRGSGTFAAPVNAGTQTIIAPGSSGTATAIMTFQQAITLGADSVLDINLNGTTAGSGYDQIRLTDNATLDVSNLTLNARIGFNPPAPYDALFYIVRNDTGNPISGTFDGLVQGQQFIIPGVNGARDHFARISYTGDPNAMSITGGTSIVIYDVYPVPEPGWVLAIAGLAFGGVAVLRRIRRTPEVAVIE